MIKNQRMVPSSEFTAVIFTFAANYPHVNLALAFVGWFSIGTIKFELTGIEIFMSESSLVRGCKYTLYVIHLFKVITCWFL